jgi:hypothetical protein
MNFSYKDKILSFYKYNSQIITQFLIKICGTPETLWRHTSMLWHTGCRIPASMDYYPCSNIRYLKLSLDLCNSTRFVTVL